MFIKEQININLLKLFKCMKHSNIWNTFDINFAILMLKKQRKNSLAIISAHLSYYTRIGNICLPLKILTPKYFNRNGIPMKINNMLYKLSNCSSELEWVNELLFTKVVGKKDQKTPIILCNNNLYIYRLWNYENKVVKFLIRLSKSKNYINSNIIKNTIKSTFKNEIEYSLQQRIVITTVLIRSLIFILGRPGTGKTFLILKILKSFKKLKENKKLNIAITAPTGKATVKIKETLKPYLKDITDKKDNLSILTIHNLIGANQHNRSNKYNKKNKLNLDLLIIDEASMISVSLMSKLFDALSNKIKLVIIGDYNQLPSIDGGLVLKDICKIYTGYSKSWIYTLKKYNKIDKIKEANKNYSMSNSICFLKKNYRFEKKSNIHILSELIISGKANKVLNLLNNKKLNNINFNEILNHTKYFNMIKDCANLCKDYILKIINQCNPQKILKSFNSFKILCAIHNGIFGTEYINKKIENEVIKDEKIFNLFNQLNIVGRPITITKNCYSLNLYNGDTGIVFYEHNSLYAYFSDASGKIKKVLFNKIPKYEISFVTTIHKAQGLEFEKILIILPNNKHEILNRELLYTAITRSKKDISIYVNKEILYKIIKSKSKRYSLISQKIKNVELI